MFRADLHLHCPFSLSLLVRLWVYLRLRLTGWLHQAGLLHLSQQIPKFIRAQ
jgi:hypothetical protein